MKTNNELLLLILKKYHQFYEQEKIALFLIQEVRSNLENKIRNYDQSGRSRKVNQQKLDLLLQKIKNHSIDPAEFLPLLNELRFPIEFWNNLRQLADSLPFENIFRWKEIHLKTCALRNDILEQTAHLVSKIRRFHFSIDENRVDDADGNGFLGLLKAIDNFTEQEGRSFEAYAKVYILNQIVYYLRNDKLVKPSDALRRFYQRHDLIVENLRQIYRREPTAQELATALEIDLDELTSKQDRRGNAISLDAEIGEEEETTLHDTIGHEAALPYERMENHLVIDRLHDAMRGLSHAESAIVNLRWPPVQESQLQGTIHQAPLAFEKMEQRSFFKLYQEIQKTALPPDTCALTYSADLLESREYQLKETSYRKEPSPQLLHTTGGKCGDA